ncbi:hypothetical protein [Cohaesibacter haloalkalitolerans]|uniref:hypothetical protein n=1 Tax=Cohaesibacter haloalkalitolerans TaxID=1162980 RepID=UPI000E65AC37|nr:hypothetical protein [Cohaesibacter haloalkalitolerans]
MFEAVDQSFDFPVTHASSLAKETESRSEIKTTKAPSEATLEVLKAGFRTRVMSYRSAYDLGARSGLSLSSLKSRTEQSARLIQAGLGYAVDETVFATLVFHYPELAKALSRQR